MDPGPASWAAVVLAGGTAARLDGADKASLVLDGSTLLERALAAVRDAVEVVVVGDPVPTSRPVSFVREEPPLGGPVAGLVAGRRALVEQPAAVLVLAVDMPFVTATTVSRLLAAATGRDGAALVGGDGRRRLALLLPTGVLDAVTPADPHGHAVGALLDGLDVAEVPAVGDEARGIDTWADLRDARHR